MTLMVAVEGDTDLPFVRELAADAGFDVRREIDCAGKSRLDEALPSYNGAAKGSPWLVLRDLDHDAECAVALIAARRLVPSRWMCFRVAVRELESWVLADAEGFADFYAVPVNAVPDRPVEEDDPTRTIVNLIRRSRNAGLRRGIGPRPGVSASVGYLYETKLIEFGEEHWSVARASRRSDSLRRARRALRRLYALWADYARGKEQ
jgi:hypothetical protein